MTRQMNIILFLCIAVMLFLCACNGQGIKGANVVNVAPEPVDEVARLAENGTIGASTQVFDPVLGGGQAIVADAYVSALGAACRRVNFIDQAGRRHNLAVCADEKGVWTTAAPVFTRPMAGR